FTIGGGAVVEGVAAAQHQVAAGERGVGGAHVGVRGGEVLTFGSLGQQVDLVHRSTAGERRTTDLIPADDLLPLRYGTGPECRRVQPQPPHHGDGATGSGPVGDPHVLGQLLLPAGHDHAVVETERVAGHRAGAGGAIAPLLPADSPVDGGGCLG